MKASRISLPSKWAAVAIFSMIAAALALTLVHRNQITPVKKNNGRSNLQLISQVFRDGGVIPQQYTCKGPNVNPPLNFAGVPATAKSLTLIVHDPDAVGGDYTHWVVYDIPASAKVIAVSALPVGAIQGLNSGGNPDYAGPCPPAGTGVHHYKFELYALDKTLSLSGKVSRTQVESAMKGHVIAQTLLTGIVAAD